MADPGTAVVGPVTIGAIAHGGHAVARHDGRVVFVRHGLPGEQVMVRLTDTSHDRYWSGDAVEVLESSPHRVNPPCPVSGPGGCGGCDFQHVEPAHQRELKRRVVAEQLSRLAGIEWDGEVEQVSDEGEPWRTRTRWFADGGGGWGLRRHHSHDVVTLGDGGCRIALAEPPEPPEPGERTAEVVRGGDGELTWSVDGKHRGGPDPVHQRSAGRDYRVGADGFWQVHPQAADVLVSAVLDGLDPRPGERALDLYCGVGLFAGALATAGVRVWGVEGSAAAIDLARTNVAEANFRAGRVERVLQRLPRQVDLVVLDPPRRGARRAVMEAVLERRPRRIAHVACDPSALARDLGIAAEHGWQATSVRAFDLFPMTHHVECVAILERSV